MFVSIILVVWGLRLWRAESYFHKSKILKLRLFHFSWMSPTAEILMVLRGQIQMWQFLQNTLTPLKPLFGKRIKHHQAYYTSKCIYVHISINVVINYGGRLPDNESQVPHQYNQRWCRPTHTESMSKHASVSNRRSVSNCIDRILLLGLESWKQLMMGKLQKQMCRSRGPVSAIAHN